MSFTMKVFKKKLRFVVCFLIILLIHSENAQAADNISKFSFSPFQKKNSCKGLQSLGLPSISNFTPKRYQGHPNNYSIVQDKMGVMYFGNLWGVIEFNGTTWRKIPLPNKSGCISLAIDLDGTIFVGGRNEIGFLKSDSIGRKYYVSLTHILPSGIKNFDEVWKIFTTPEGIYFSSNSLLLFKSRKKNRIEVIKNSNNAFQVNGSLYTSDYSGIYVVKGTEVQRLPHTETLINQYINMMGNLKDQILISTSENGIYLYDGRNLHKWNSEINGILKRYNPSKIINLDDHYLIISTELGGVFITDIEGKVLLNLNKSTGIKSNTITDIFLDKDRDLWLTLNNGISHVQLFNQYSYINDYLGVSGIPYSSAVYNGKLYLATSEGLFYHDLKTGLLSRNFSKVTDFSGLVWNLKVIDDKLFCGHAITCHVIDHDKKAENLYNAGTWQFLQLSEKKILMGTYNGLHYLKKVNNRWTYSKKIKGFDESSRYFAVDDVGDIWVSHGSKGVFQLRLNISTDSVVRMKQHSFIGEQRIGTNYVTKINHEIIVATEFGVFKYDPEKDRFIKHEEFARALKGSGASMVLNEKENKIWAVDPSGVLIELKKGVNDGFKAVVKTKKFKDDLIKDFEHVHALASGLVIVGTQEGFVIYNPELKSNHSSFQTFISGVELSNPLLRLRQGCTLSTQLLQGKIPFKQNTLKFTFSANSYEDLMSNQYSYYLKGFDTNGSWSPWSLLNYKEYTNLSPGQYTLYVKAMNFEGKIGKSAALHFEILAPWYRMPLAYFGYAILALSLTVLIFVQVKKRFIRERRRLQLEKERELWNKQKEWEAEEIKRKKAMMELEQEKLYMESVALQQKELLLEQEKQQERKILDIQKEKLETEIHYKNNELSSLTLHITQKNELLTKIRSQTKKLKQEFKDPEMSKILHQIELLIHKGLSSGKEWEKFTEHFNFVHDGFLQRLKQEYPDLKTNSLKLCAYLKMRLSSKQIAVMMNTAPASVMKARYRLRLKFNLEKDEGLEDFLHNF